jgi:glucose dehydrogenase
VPAIALGFVVGRSEKQDTKTVVQTPAMAAKSLIKTAPAFSTDDLWQTASDDWITNGGSTSNQRYSSLDEINDGNVQNLRGVWLTHLRKSGLAAKYSAESQPLEYQGVIYVPTGQDDVFAVSADTGEILWEYKAHLDQTISVVCCGWESRGVALGEGKVYIGQLDGSLVALDQKTGQVAWKTQVARWQDGYSVTAAPLYINGMVVTGVSGGEFGTRGSVTAYDATTGKQKWRFYTIPGPGQTGHSRTTPGRPAAPPSGRRRRWIRSSGRCTSRRATQVPTTTAAPAPARTCSPRRWSRSTCRPGSSSGGTRWCTTTSGTTTRRARRSSSTPR